MFQTGHPSAFLGLAILRKASITSSRSERNSLRGALRGLSLSDTHGVVTR